MQPLDDSAISLSSLKKHGTNPGLKGLNPRMLVAVVRLSLSYGLSVCVAGHGVVQKIVNST